MLNLDSFYIANLTTLVFKVNVILTPPNLIKILLILLLYQTSKFFKYIPYLFIFSQGLVKSNNLNS